MTRINFCKFSNGEIVSSTRDLDNTQFIATSHVWGFAKLQKLSNFKNPILCTAYKAAWIERELHKYVGDTFFWMDILAVNQSIKGERMTVVRHIPTIYRKAKKTLILRGSEGFGPCYRLVTELERHIAEYHPNGFSEDWLLRVWPLQELCHSDEIEFVTHPRELGPREIGELNGAQIVQLFEEIDKIAYHWATRGCRAVHSGREDEVDTLQRELVEAVIYNGGASRRSLVDQRSGILGAPKLLMQQLRSSLRTTSKSRDYILAVFPQFEWYTVPDSVSEMKFGDLYVDLSRQLEALPEKVNWKNVDGTSCTAFQLTGMWPRYVNGLLEGYENDARASWHGSRAVPCPKTFADSVELFYLRLEGPEETVPHITGESTLHLFDDNRVQSPMAFVTALSLAVGQSDRAAVSKWRNRLKDWAKERETLLALILLIEIGDMGEGHQPSQALSDEFSAKLREDLELHCEEGTLECCSWLCHMHITGLRRSSWDGDDISLNDMEDDVYSFR